MTSQPYIGDDLVGDYNEQQIAPAYAEAKKQLDKRYPIWSGRAVFDHADGMSWETSCAKHLAECRAALGLVDPIPPPGPVPMLRVADTRFYDALTGSTWKWRGASAFRLFELFLKGENIGPFCRWALTSQINILRVFGAYNGGIGRLIPTEYPTYGAQLPRFLDVVNGYGLSVEFTIFADMQTPALAAINQASNYQTVINILRGRAGVVVEICNEPFKNGVVPESLYQPLPDLMQALGSYDFIDGQIKHADYVTMHTDRGPEWPRKAKDMLEVSRLGWDGFTALRHPCIGDEPLGIGPEQPGSRSMVAADHAAYHGVAALFSSGSTIHSTFGVQTRLPTAEEQRCLAAATATMQAVPPECATWKYTAGHLGDCPLENQGLRVYGMIDAGRAVCVLVRPTGPPVARDGWRIVSQRGYQGLVVELAR